MQISTQEAPAILTEIMLSGLVPMLTSSPGMGKSAIAAQIAEAYELKLIDIRLAQCDPVDLLGFPSVVDGKATYLPFDTFPIEGDTPPKGYKGWLILFDEMNSAPMSVQAAAYRVILDKEVGQHKLHKKVWMMAAGNLSTDRAIVNRMSTAMQSRMIHVQLELDYKAWLQWFNENEGDHRIASYIAFKPTSIHQFKADHDDHTFACPRTWTFLSSMSKKWSDITHSNLPIIAGTIGEAVGREFQSFCQCNFTMTIEEILAAPETVKIPTEPSTIYAISGLVSNHMNDKNVDILMKFTNRLSPEFAIITIKNALVRNKRTLLQTPTMKQWILENATELL